MKSQFLHNANHPIEHHIVDVAHRIFENHKWPLDKVLVHITFGVRSGFPSQSRINSSMKEGQLHGEARLFYNYLHAMQHPSEFIKDIVPHEIAHLFIKHKSITTNVNINEHGDEWKQMLYVLSSEATPASKGPGHIFDDRPIKLLKGGTPTVCSCHDPYFIVSSVSESKIGDLHCKDCESIYKKISREELPAILIEQYEYIVDEQIKRGAHAMTWK